MSETGGKIIKSIGGFYHVETPNGVLICKARGIFRLNGISPCAGDVVTVLQEEQNEPVITAVEERKNVLIRPPLANLDIVFIVVSTTEPNPNPLILDKLIFVIESKGIEPVPVFTKTDKKIPEELIGIYRKAGFKVILTDNQTGVGAEEIKNCAKDKVSAVIGNTGVGKSSLLNHLLPDITLGTGEISKKLGRGRHTTRQVELYKLPDGGYIADTPGFSTVEAARYGTVAAEDVAGYFREISPFLGKCLYAGCRHLKEDGCVVIKAVETGEISHSRYDSYVRIYNDARTEENTY